jgi:hypothetical protein
MSILNPNLTAEQSSGATNVVNLIWVKLQKIGIKADELKNKSEELSNLINELRLDGPATFIDSYEKFAKKNAETLASYQAYLGELHDFEKAFLTWATGKYGEDKIKELLFKLNSLKGR